MVLPSPKLCKPGKKVRYKFQNSYPQPVISAWPTQSLVGNCQASVLNFLVESKRAWVSVLFLFLTFLGPLGGIMPLIPGFNFELEWHTKFCSWCLMICSGLTTWLIGTLCLWKPWPMMFLVMLLRSFAGHTS